MVSVLYMKHKNILLVVCCLLLYYYGRSQNYHAIHGSVYAGSLATAANPAAIAFVPYAWDVTPFSLQFKQSSNAYIVKGFSFLSPSASATVENTFGIKKRYFFASQDLRLLNARINLNATSAIAFGANIRSYVYGFSGKSNYQDTTYSLSDFQRINTENQPMSFDGAGAAWSEVYATYAKNMVDDGYKIINAAVTIKLNRSIAGAYAIGEQIGYVPENSTGSTNRYLLTSGTVQYGYSSNLDQVKSNNSFSQNRQALLSNSATSIGADVGIEYIFPSTVDDDDDNYFAYKTKIGVAVMDIGGHRYTHSNKSRAGSAVKPGINDTLLENKFRSVNNIDAFNDSLATIANNLVPLEGDFVVYSPTRLLLNIDYRLQENIFLNAELTLPLIAIAKNSLFIKDINLLSITPRWENRTWGAYLPLLVNMRKQVWVGGAFKAGPLLLGVHNLANIFGKNSLQNGGLYLALTIRPGKKKDGFNNGDADPEKRRKLKRLKCTAF